MVMGTIRSGGDDIVTEYRFIFIGFLLSGLYIGGGDGSSPGTSLS